jgi:hypothetical protein
VTAPIDLAGANAMICVDGRRRATEMEMVVQSSEIVPFKFAANDRAKLARAIGLLASDQSMEAARPSPALLDAAEELISESAAGIWIEASPEFVGGGSPDRVGMIVVRERRRLAYSIKLSNFFRDPVVSTAAAAMAAFAATYIPAAATNPPATFPGFLIALAFTLLRSVAHPIGYGEAALLHRLNQVAEEKGIVPAVDLDSIGDTLVERYGYVKGRNSNEVKALMESLKAWGAVVEVDGGFKVRESVPFGLGPLEYVER